MINIIVEYNKSEEQKLWESFVEFFRNIKGYEDWSIEEIATSYNEDDIKDYLKWVKKVLLEDK